MRGVRGAVGSEVVGDDSEMVGGDSEMVGGEKS